MKRKTKSVKFTNKGNSRRGIFSLALSAFSLLWLFVSVLQTSMHGENVSNIYGGIGTLALVLQLIALVTAVRELHEEDVFRGIPKAALTAAIVLLLLWAAVYGLGVFAFFA